MRVFLTGATGFIGSALVPELRQHGHSVLGYARSDAGADALRKLGADVHRGDLEDLDALRRGAQQADGVVHCGFIHDFSKFAENCAIDARAIDTLADVLSDSGKPLVVTAGIPGMPGRVTTEDDDLPKDHPTPRVSEQRALAAAARGVRATVVRLPQVHDRDKSGLVPFLIAIARQKGVSAYVGDGLNRWAAAHRFATPSLYRLALEKGSAGARYHAVEEEGVAQKAIAEAIGRGLKLPVISVSADEAAAHFGPFGHFAAMSNPASSTLTRARLGWHPGTHPGLIDDLDHANEFAA
ncbi:MAG: SDR family oxidoreductase [Burkholderiales bacterium]|nr:SDR family oxidoreductase [Burkholderiales bacterium]